MPDVFVAEYAQSEHKYQEAPCCSKLLVQQLNLCLGGACSSVPNRLLSRSSHLPISGQHAEQGGKDAEAVGQDVHDDAQAEAAQPHDEGGEDELQHEDQQPVPGLPVVLQ